MTFHASHDLECARAAYAILIERAEANGDLKEARFLRREFKQYRTLALSSPHLGSEQ